MRILVVEDDDLIGAAIARALRDAAYVADWVGSMRPRHWALCWVMSTTPFYST